jgi:hypothetical protein
MIAAGACINFAQLLWRKWARVDQAILIFLGLGG